jgi:hypothetical protein
MRMPKSQGDFCFCWSEHLLLIPNHLRDDFSAQMISSSSLSMTLIIVFGCAFIMIGLSVDASNLSGTHIFLYGYICLCVEEYI